MTGARAWVPLNAHVTDPKPETLKLKPNTLSPTTQTRYSPIPRAAARAAERERVAGGPHDFASVGTASHTSKCCGDSMRHVHVHIDTTLTAFEPEAQMHTLSHMLITCPNAGATTDIDLCRKTPELYQMAGRAS